MVNGQLIFGLISFGFGTAVRAGATQVTSTKQTNKLVFGFGVSTRATVGAQTSL